MLNNCILERFSTQDLALKTPCLVSTYIQEPRQYQRQMTLNGDNAMITSINDLITFLYDKHDPLFTKPVPWHTDFLRHSQKQKGR